MAIFRCDLDEIRTRCFTKGGPDGKASEAQAVEDRMHLLALLDDAEQEAKQHAADMAELKDRFQEAEGKLKRARRYLEKAGEVINGL
jgi:hypothetical protein